MKAMNVKNCAAPGCSQVWHRLGEGKLFTFHIRHIETEQRSVKNVWLCEACFEKWQPTVERHEIVLMPLMQRAG